MTPALLAALISLIEEGIKTVPAILAALHQTGELTDADYAAFKGRMEAAFASPEWQPTPGTTTTTTTTTVTTPEEEPKP